MASSNRPHAPVLDAFVGLSAVDGRAISGEAHLTQSMRKIITTPIGTRTMNRLFGSKVPRHLGAPMTRGLVADVVSDAADAISTWEPRVQLKRIVVAEVEPGRLGMTIIDRQDRAYPLGALS